MRSFASRRFREMYAVVNVTARLTVRFVPDVVTVAAMLIEH
jgi:hypothetical protein